MGKREREVNGKREREVNGEEGEGGEWGRGRGR